METLNFNAQFSTTPEATLAFAILNGYNEFVSIDEIDEKNGATITKQFNNPQTPEEFICEYMRNYIANELNRLNCISIESNFIEKINSSKKESFEKVKEQLNVDLK